MPSPPSRLATLLDTGREELTREAIAEARALGREAAGAIAGALVEAEATRARSHHQAVNAATLAGELRLVPAVPALVACIEHLSDHDPLAHAAAAALARLRDESAEALLAAFERCPSPERRTRIAYVLTLTGVRDRRIRAALVALLRDVPLHAAPLLAEYGDREALPALSGALDAAALDPPGADPLTANEHLVELASAIRALGGDLTPAQRVKLEEVFARHDAHWRAGALFRALRH